ncbi:hypothetical protein [Caballeronia sp. J97]|uniref:hypothetical protein n=1 Tax=Caballeronia sp. J97 TaxID=2805429 RepID=UPI002AB1E50D|nr:hypothetical protein [Caballeronia sp. J97]
MARSKLFIPKSRKNKHEKLHTYAFNVEEGASLAYSELTALPFDVMCAALSELRRTTPERNQVFGIVRPATYSELCVWKHIFYSDNPRDDIQLAAAEIRAFYDVVKTFLKCEAAFDGHVLSQNFEEALAVLDLLDDESGVSLWSLSNRLAILEQLNGVDAQKAVANEIRNSDAVSGALRSLVYFFSLRAEKTVSPARYQAAVARAYKNDPSEPRSSVSYLDFHLNIFPVRGLPNLITAINFERGSSIIDRYLTFIRVAQAVAATEYNRAAWSYFREPMQALADKICDDRIAILVMRFAGTKHLHKGYSSQKQDSITRYASIVDSYTRGDYENVQLMTESLPLDEYGRGVELFCRSAARTPRNSDGKNSAYSFLLDPYINLLRKTDRADLAYGQLAKIVQTFHYSQWAAELLAVISRETVATGQEYHEHTFEIGMFNGHAASPRLHLHLFGADARESSISSSLTFRFLAFGTEGESGLPVIDATAIPSFRARRYRANRLREANQLDEAIDEISSLATPPYPSDTLDAQSAIILLLSLYLEKGKPAHAARVAAEALCNWPRMSMRIELGEVIYRYKESIINDAEPVPDIFVTACFGLLAELYSPDAENDLSIKCEQFLSGIGVGKPTELRTRVSGWNVHVLIFFLHAMCKPEILDSHVSYDTPTEVFDERVAILQWLIELDEDRRFLYTEEIAQITQRQLIRKGVQLIEKSRIQVDIDGIQDAVEKDFIELYTRYTTLPKDGPAQSDVVIRLSPEGELGSVVLVLPVNERRSALLQLLHLVRDRFVSSNEHGLDVYLSVGIRHGTLSGQLRSVLEKSHLVSQKNKRGTYDGNDFWRGALAEDDVDEVDIDRADSALRDLSQSADKLIAKLRDKWIQIRTEDKNPEGFFNFTVSTSDVAELSRALDATSGHQQALEAVFHFLWKKTDVALTNIRSVLKDEFKAEFAAVIDSCLNEIGYSQDESSLQRLRSTLLRARTDMQSEIDDIAEWFTRSSDASLSEYQFKFALDVALEMVSRCYPQHSLDLEVRSVPVKIFPGTTWKGIVEILFIAFDNMLKHCGRPDGRISAELECTVDAEKIEIRLASAVAEPVQLTEQNVKLAERLEAVLSDKSTDTVRREGGSGFFKIAKIVRVDFASQLGLWFGYENPTHFLLKLNMTGGSPFDEYSGR